MRAYLEHTPKITSLDQMACSNNKLFDDSSILELVTDNGQLIQEEKLEIEQGLEHLESLLAELPERERWCLELRYGIDADGLGPLTYQAIGELMDVSRERVRQIEAKCLKRMRNKLNPIRRNPS